MSDNEGLHDISKGLLAQQVTGIGPGYFKTDVEIQYERWLREEAQRQMNHIGLMKPNTSAIPPMWQDPTMADPFNADIIFRRLRMTRDEVKAKGIDFGTIRKVGDRVDVVVLTQDKTFVMEDNAGLFPSDNFITKIRVLL